MVKIKVDSGKRVEQYLIDIDCLTGLIVYALLTVLSDVPMLISTFCLGILVPMTFTGLVNKYWTVFCLLVLLGYIQGRGILLVHVCCVGIGCY